MKNYVYVLEKEPCFCKIGATNNPKDRISVLETQGGFYAKRIALFGPFDVPNDCEVAAHRLFSDKRAIGEWFTASYEDIVSALRSLFDTNETTFRTNRSGPQSDYTNKTSPPARLTLQKLAAIFEILPESKKEYLIGYAEGIAAAKAEKKD